MLATVIVNRRAKRFRRRGALLDDIDLAVEQSRGRLRLVETSCLDELRAATDDIAREASERADGVPKDADPSAVLFAGGDGSYMAGATALVASCARANVEVPTLGLLPGGTVGTIARNWGFLRKIWGSTSESSERRCAGELLRTVLSGSARIRPRPTLRVRGPDGDRIGFIAGTGLVARFFELYEEAGADGYQTAAKLVGKIFASSLVGGRLARRVLDPMACEIEVDGARTSLSCASLVCASVVRNLGLGMRLLYRAAEESERFHFVASPLPPFQLGPQLPLVLAGRPLVGPKLDLLAREVTVRFPGGRGAYVLDGDLLRGDLTIQAGPTLPFIDMSTRSTEHG